MGRSIRIGLLGAMIVGMATSAAAQRLTGTPGLIIGQQDFVRLHWIEGSWRGKSDSSAPRYERYHFINDSTLVMESFADAKFSRPAERVRYEWRDRRFASTGSSGRWAATAFDSASVTFTPLSPGHNTFIWQRVDDDHWTVALSWPPSVDKPARQVVYHMERIKSGSP